MLEIKLPQQTVGLPKPITSVTVNILPVTELIRPDIVK
jgi:hypothetical protein